MHLLSVARCGHAHGTVCVVGCLDVAIPVLVWKCAGTKRSDTIRDERGIEPGDEWWDGDRSSWFGVSSSCPGSVRASDRRPRLRKFTGSRVRCCDSPIRRRRTPEPRHPEPRLRPPTPNRRDPEPRPRVHPVTQLLHPLVADVASTSIACRVELLALEVYPCDWDVCVRSSCNSCFSSRQRRRWRSSIRHGRRHGPRRVGRQSSRRPRSR